MQLTTEVIHAQAFQMELHRWCGGGGVLKQWANLKELCSHEVQLSTKTKKGDILNAYCCTGLAKCTCFWSILHTNIKASFQILTSVTSLFLTHHISLFMSSICSLYLPDHDGENRTKSLY